MTDLSALEPGSTPGAPLRASSSDEALARRAGRRRAGATTLVATVGRTRRYLTTNRRRSVTLRLVVSKALRARLRVARTRRLALAVRPTTPTGARATVTLRVAVPR